MILIKKEAPISCVFIKQLILPVRNSQGGFLLIVLIQLHPRLPLMRELSAKLTEGENSAPNDQHTHIHRRNLGQYPNCKSLLPPDSWLLTHWCVVHLFSPAPACNVHCRQVREPISLLHNKSLQYNYLSPFVFGNVPDSCAKKHTTISVPKESCFSATP